MSSDENAITEMVTQCAAVHDRFGRCQLDPAHGGSHCGPHGNGWEPSQDCRSDDGVIVGLIDGMIAQARIVARHLRQNQPSGGITEALADLRSDEDIALLVRRDRARVRAKAVEVRKALRDLRREHGEPTVSFTEKPGEPE